MPQAIAVGVFKAVLAIGISLSLSRIQEARARRKTRRNAKFGNLERGLSVNYSATDARMPFLYGQIRAGGLEVLPPYSNGYDRVFTYRVIAHSIGKVADIISPYLDSTAINTSQLTVSSLAGYQPTYLSPGPGGVPGYSFNKAVGASSHFAPYLLAAGVSTLEGLDNGFAALFENFRGNNIAYTTSRYELNNTRDNFQAVPATSFLIKGICCYDPRLDSTRTGGSGSHRFNDPSTWEYSECPPIQLAHHLTHFAGGGYEESEIDWDSFMTAADICDELVAVPGGTQKRFTSHGTVYAPTTTNELIENLEAFTDAMMGRLIYSRGQWRAYAGSWETPTTTIQSADWLTSPKVTVEQGDRARFNYISAFFNSDSSNYEPTQLSVTNSAYQVADGGLVPFTTNLPMCVNAVEARRKLMLQLRMSRNQILVNGRLPPRFSDLGMFETVTLVDSRFGWTAKTGRLIANTNYPDGSRDVSIIEEQSTDWADPSTSDYTTSAVSFAIPSVNALNLSPPSSLGIVPLNGYLQFSVGPSSMSPPEMNYLLYRNSVNSVGGASIVWRGAARTGEYTPVDASTAYYWSRVELGAQVSSLTHPNSSGIAAAPVVVPSAPNSFSAVPQINGTILFNWTRPNTYEPGSFYEIIRSTNSGDASVGTTVWQGDAQLAPLVMPNSPHWYYVRAGVSTYRSPYTPNTFGIGRLSYGEADATLTSRIIPDAEFDEPVQSSYWFIDQNNGTAVFGAAYGQLSGGVLYTAHSATPRTNLTVFNTLNRGIVGVNDATYRARIRFKRNTTLTYSWGFDFGEAAQIQIGITACDSPGASLRTQEGAPTSSYLVIYPNCYSVGSWTTVETDLRFAANSYRYIAAFMNLIASSGQLQIDAFNVTGQL